MPCVVRQRMLGRLHACTARRSTCGKTARLWRRSRETLSSAAASDARVAAACSQAGAMLISSTASLTYENFTRAIQRRIGERSPDGVGEGGGPDEPCPQG